MVKRWQQIFFLVWGILGVGTAGAGHGSVRMPGHINQAEIYLLTVGLGSSIESRYGHTIVRMVDPLTQEEHALNWGMFSFADPYLPLKFFLGHLRYWVSDSPYQETLEYYLFAEKRPVFSDRLVLTPAQKRRIYAQVIAATAPGREKFWYQYFFKNCATIPRDFVDQALDGRMSAALKTRFSTWKFRDYVREHLNRPPVVAFFLDIVMNSRLDQPLTQWDEMFYPPKLREYLAAFPALDDAGRPIPGQRLLDESQRLNTLEDVPSADWRLSPFFLLCGLIFVAAGLLGLAGQRAAGTGRWLRLWAIGLGLWGLFAGTLGTVMTLAWMFSAHLDLHHNANLWFFWPLDFAYLGLAWKVWRHGRIPRWGGWLSALHLAAAILGLSLWAFGAIEQNLSWVGGYVVPVGLGLWTVALARRRQQNPKLK